MDHTSHRRPGAHVAHPRPDAGRLAARMSARRRPGRGPESAVARRPSGRPPSRVRSWTSAAPNSVCHVALRAVDGRRRQVAAHDEVGHGARSRACRTAGRTATPPAPGRPSSRPEDVERPLPGPGARACGSGRTAPPPTCRRAIRRCPAPCAGRTRGRRRGRRRCSCSSADCGPARRRTARTRSSLRRRRGARRARAPLVRSSSRNRSSRSRMPQPCACDRARAIVRSLRRRECECRCGGPRTSSPSAASVRSPSVNDACAPTTPLNIGSSCVGREEPIVLGEAGITAPCAAAVGDLVTQDAADADGSERVADDVERTRNGVGRRVMIDDGGRAAAHGLDGANERAVVDRLLIQRFVELPPDLAAGSPGTIRGARAGRRHAAGEGRVHVRVRAHLAGHDELARAVLDHFAGLRLQPRAARDDPVALDTQVGAHQARRMRDAAGSHL